MELRPERVLRFADGGVLVLGRRTAVMGVLNVTPDSFSDGGRFGDPSAATVAAQEMAAAGAEVIDVGGESTRPGADPVSGDEEAARVVPVVRAVKREVGVRVSIDTRKASVARRALDAGADLVNDVSALGDPEMLPLLSERRIPVVLMHMRGTPRTMQQDTTYDDLLSSVLGFLRERVARAVEAGLDDGKIVVDPGIGFGKSAAGNLTLLARLGELGSLGRPILIGVSRKSFFGALFGLAVDQRMEVSLAAAAFASAQGAHLIRAHDVAATARAVRTIDAIRDPTSGLGS